VRETRTAAAAPPLKPIGGLADGLGRERRGRAGDRERGGEREGERVREGGRETDRQTDRQREREKVGENR